MILHLHHQYNKKHHIYRQIEEFEDQLFLFANCETLITEVGSTACNAWLMPRLKVGLELCIQSVLGAWGLHLASTVIGFEFFRIDGSKVDGSLKRFDGDNSKAPLGSDFDFVIDPIIFEKTIQAMISSSSD